MLFFVLRSSSSSYFIFKPFYLFISRIHMVFTAEGSSNTKSHRTRYNGSSGMSLRLGRRGFVFGEVVQRRKWILSIRTKRRSAGADIPVTRRTDRCKCMNKRLGAPPPRGEKKEEWRVRVEWPDGATIDVKLFHNMVLRSIFRRKTIQRTVWSYWTMLICQRRADIGAKYQLKLHHFKQSLIMEIWLLLVSLLELFDKFLLLFSASKITYSVGKL